MSSRAYGGNNGPVIADNSALVTGFGVTTVPLPAAGFLLLSGLGTLGGFARRRPAA